VLKPLFYLLIRCKAAWYCTGQFPNTNKAGMSILVIVIVECMLLKATDNELDGSCCICRKDDIEMLWVCVQIAKKCRANTIYTEAGEV
jgi:hypothetical protein